MSPILLWPANGIFKYSVRCAMLWVQMSPQRQRRIPEVEFCAEKHRLENEFLTAIREVVGVLDQQSRALIDGQAEFSHFRLLLHLAHEKKDEAKYALLAHIEAHHCEEG